MIPFCDRERSPRLLANQASFLLPDLNHDMCHHATRRCGHVDADVEGDQAPRLAASPRLSGGTEDPAELHDRTAEPVQLREDQGVSLASVEASEGMGGAGTNCVVASLAWSAIHST